MLIIYLFLKRIEEEKIRECSVIENILLDKLFFSYSFIFLLKYFFISSMFVLLLLLFLRKAPLFFLFWSFSFIFLIL
jgi:hypothetical protein